MSILSQQKQSVNTDFPNIRPSLDLRFALAKKLDPRITFTRGSTGTYFGPDGLMRTAAANEPRFDHDPVTGQSLGLLVEESRQNLLLYSNGFDNASWSKNSVTHIPNSIIAPDGTTTAYKSVENTTTNLHRTSQTVSKSAVATTYTFSIFVKVGERNGFEFGMTDASGYVDCFANLTTGTFTGVPVVSGSWVLVSYGSVSYPNGWYRFYVSSTTTAQTSVLPFFGTTRSPGSANNYTGDGTSGIYIWGAQLEPGAFPTSYIPTSGSTVTRSADNAYMTGTNFSSWYNSSEGTIVISTDKLYSGNFDAYRHYYQIGDATANNAFGTIYTNINTTFITNYGTTNGGRQVFDYQQISIGSSPTQFKVGQSLNSKYSFFTSSKGTTTPQLPSRSAPNSHNNTTPTSVDRMWIGRKVSGGEINSHIARLTYYPIQITNQQLINLTS